MRHAWPEDRVELHMAVARGLDAVADRAYGLAQNLHISDSIFALRTAQVQQ